MASARPTATPASPPIPASTSSNTSVGGASESTTRRASIVRDSSPPDAALASGRAGSPGFGREQERDVVGAVVADRRRFGRPTSRCRCVNVGRRRGRARAEPSVTAPASRGAAARRAFDSARGRVVDLGVRRRGARRRAAAARASCCSSSSSRAPRRRAAYSTTSASVGPYLRLSSREQRAPGLHALQPLGIVDDRLLGRAHVVRGFLQLGLQQPRAGSRARRTARARRARPPRRRPRPSPGPSSARYAVAESLAVRFGVGQQLRPPARSRSSSSRVDDRRPRRSRRPGSAAGRPRAPATARRRRARRARRRSRARSRRAAAQRRERGLCLRRPRSGRAARAARPARAATGARAARAGRRGAGRTRRARPTVASRPFDVAARPARRRARPARARPRRRRRRSDPRRAPRSRPRAPAADRRGRPQSRSSASTSNVLPAPVSPVITVRPAPSVTCSSAMMPRFSTRSSDSIGLPVREPELGLQDLVEVARPHARRAAAARARRGTARDRPEQARPARGRRPSSATGRPSVTTNATSSCSASTSDRSNSMCGEIGVSTRQRRSGDTIGPPAENEYAVCPVGVATMRPSAAYVVNALPLIDTSR